MLTCMLSLTNCTRNMVYVVMAFTELLTVMYQNVCVNFWVWIRKERKLSLATSVMAALLLLSKTVNVLILQWDWLHWKVWWWELVVVILTPVQWHLSWKRKAWIQQEFLICWIRRAVYWVFPEYQAICVNYWLLVLPVMKKQFWLRRCTIIVSRNTLVLMLLH